MTLTLHLCDDLCRIRHRIEARLPLEEQLITAMLEPIDTPHA